MEVRSDMPGVALDVAVAVGARVDAGQTLVLIESMKMEIPVEAPVAGTVAQIHIASGEQIEEGQLLVTLNVA